MFEDHPNLQKNSKNLGMNTLPASMGFPPIPGVACFEIFGSLRAKGALISEPRFSTPCGMRFFPREKGKIAFVEGFSLKRPFSLSRVGKIVSRRG